MFPRDLLPLSLVFFCIFYCRCYAQVISQTKKTEATMSESMILSAAMVCSMFTVVIVLVPTVLYYRYCSKEEDDE